jgi:Cu(I)/Ag(I) efflux system membrane protein CusA/SilA
MLEAGEQRLSTLPPGASAAERRQALLLAARTVTPAVVVALLITSAGFLPALAFTGETGRLLTPLVMGELLVVLAAALVTATVAPALRAQILGRGRIGPGRLTGWLQAAYRPLVHVALRSPRVTLALGGLAVLSCVPLILRQGGEFLPEVDEGTLLYMPTTRDDVSPHQAAEVVRAIDAFLTRQPGVASAFGKVGRAETASDPAPYSMAEVTIALRPPGQRPTVEQRRWWSGLVPSALAAPLRRLWPDRRPMRAAELSQVLDRALDVPGWTNAWTQPIRGRISMVATGVQTEVAVRIEAPEVARIDELGRAVVAALRERPDTRAAAYQPSGGGVEFRLEPDPAALARLGLPEDEPARLFRAARDGVSTAAVAGTPVVVVFPPEQTRLAPGIAALPVAPGVRLGAVARPVAVEAPLMLRLQDGRRIGEVQVDLEPGRDPLRYVASSRQALATIPLRPGESLTWSGQYALARSGQARLAGIAALSLVMVVALLWWQLRRLVEVLIVLAAVPFALVGSVWALHLLRYEMSPAVWVGMLSLVGLATQTGIVMVVYIDVAFFTRLRRGLVRGPEDIKAAHAEGTIARVRPKVMTLAAMAAGLVPLLWADGPGAEIIRRVAAPMLGGLLSSAFLTLELVPVLYTLWRTRQLQRARREGRSLAEVVGPPPRWSGS